MAAKEQAKSQGENEGKIIKLASVNEKLILAIDRQ